MVLGDVDHLVGIPLVLVEIHGCMMELKVLELGSVARGDVLLVLRGGANVVGVVSGALDLVGHVRYFT